MSLRWWESPPPIGHGISIIGCAATRDENAAGTKLNMWDGAHVLQGGAKVQSLTGLATDGTGMRRLTAVFTPGQKGPLLPPDAEGLPTCAAALANAPKLQTDQIIQVNRCIIDAPTRAENILTQDGQRLYATCRLRDWSGGVDVDVVHEAMPCLYGHSDASDVPF